MSIADDIRALKESIPSHVSVIAISKTKSPEEIQEAYNAGQRDFGENKVQELVDKQPRLPADIRWHMVGHVQSNKVKYLAPFVDLIHSVDSLKLLQAINKEAIKNDRIIPVLLQVHIAQEDTKFGLREEEISEILGSGTCETLEHVRIIGVMGMATFTRDEEQVRREFRGLAEIFLRMKNTYFERYEYFREISMGMSDDYRIAMEEGSTMIRVGTLIFGERNLKTTSHG